MRSGWFNTLEKRLILSNNTMDYFEISRDKKIPISAKIQLSAAANLANLNGRNFLQPRHAIGRYKQ